MPVCPLCGNNIISTDRFCSNCGLIIEFDIHSTDSFSDENSSPAEIDETKRSTDAFISQTEKNHLGIPLAPIFDRIVAFFVDTLLIAVFLFIPGMFYFLLRDHFNQGQSIGKAVMGLRTVNYKTGIPATILQSLTRNLLAFFSISFLFNKKERHIGDIIAGTIVIKEY